MKERHDEFDRRYKAHHVVHVYRYYQCLDELSKGGWDLVHLDHDLGDEVINADTTIDGWGKTRLLTGYDVANWLCSCNDDLLPKRIIVHSINPTGGAAMCQVLKSRGVPTIFQPFHYIF